MELPYAEDVGHYWKTGSSSSDTWTERSKKVIEGLNGKVLANGFGSSGGRAAFMLAFEIEGQKYKVIWPVLPSHSGNDHAARIQAATMLYHDVKAKAMSASVLGVKAAFFSYMMLPTGQIASELSTPELRDAFPKLLA